MRRPHSHKPASVACTFAFALVLGACGGSGGTAGSADGTAPVEDSAGPTTTPQVEPLSGTDLAGFEEPPGADAVLPAGRYVSDLLGTQVALELPDDYERVHAYPGAIVLELPTDVPGGYRAFNVMTPSGYFPPEARERVQPRDVSDPPADLGAWLESNPELTVIASGEQPAAGGTSRWWDIATSDTIETSDTEVCEHTCPLYLWEAGELQWTIWPGYRQRVWEIDARGRQILAAAEASTDLFDTFADEAATMVGAIELGAETDVEVRTIAELTAGEHEVGQAGFTVIDESRGTIEVVSDGEVVVDAAPERTLDVTVGYPADSTGWGIEPAEGTHPVVLSAHGLNDLHRLSGFEEALVRAGYVVVKPRFPESSYPGGSLSGRLEQPGDLSAVLDALVAGRVPDLLAGTMDINRVGAIGVSLGGSTLHGLATATCCDDPRIGAVVIHGGLVAPFDGGWSDDSPPMLLVQGTEDATAPLEQSLGRFAELDPPAYLQTIETDGHLDWINDLSAEAFDHVLDLNLAFLDAYLGNGDPSALPSIASGIDGEWTEAEKG